MDNFLDIAIQAALEAGARIMEVYDNSNFEIELKSDNSPLTLADKRAHRTIVTLLNITGIPIISEEGIIPDFEFRKNRNLVWMVDPLDGTKEFISRNGEFTVNIALIEDNIPTIGVVYVPAQRLLYFSSEESGSYKTICNYDYTEESLEVSLSKAEKIVVVKNSDDYTVLASRSHNSIETNEHIALLRKKHSNLSIKNIGSSLKFCLIAEGNANIYPRLATTCEWDTAAGQAILTHAGGKVIDYETNEPLYYNKEELLNPWFIASN
ncbi:MAG: 3'(2'),5'-bisphosphate nucleotidase CysQ [Bacteroidota bacterium]